MNAKDSEKLLKALDDDTNTNLFNFTTKKIKEMNTRILNELCLSKKETSDVLNKLKEYIYVDEMHELKYGTYIRWIPIENPDDIQLTKGAVFCELKITDEGVKCICKNFGYSNRHFKIDMDKNLIFRKLTSQELILLSALDHLAN
jgi:hypothetical protein